MVISFLPALPEGKIIGYVAIRLCSPATHIESMHGSLPTGGHRLTRGENLYKRLAETHFTEREGTYFIFGNIENFKRKSSMKQRM